MTNQRNTVLYIGVTSNLQGRDWQHKNKVSQTSFTKKYNIDKLIYFEQYDDIESAIKREKELKGWKRDHKIELIASMNPDFTELSFL